MTDILQSNDMNCPARLASFLALFAVGSNYFLNFTGSTSHLGPLRIPSNLLVNGNLLTIDN